MSEGIVAKASAEIYFSQGACALLQRDLGLVCERSLQEAFDVCDRRDWMCWLLVEAEYRVKHALLDAELAEKRASSNAEYNAKPVPIDASYDDKIAFMDAQYAEYIDKFALLATEFKAKCAPLDASRATKLALVNACCTCDEIRTMFVCPEVPQ